MSIVKMHLPVSRAVVFDTSTRAYAGDCLDVLFTQYFMRFVDIGIL